MNENDRIDDAAQDQVDHDSMVESVIDRDVRILADTARRCSCDGTSHVKGRFCPSAENGFDAFASPRFDDDPVAAAASRRLHAAVRKRYAYKLIRDALNGLTHYVNDSIDYPDAEDRIASEFGLTEAQVKEVRALYDAEA